MRRLLVLCIGIVMGQWMAFAGLESPAGVHGLARAASVRGDWHEAVRHWSHAVTLRPDNAYFQYMRASALARLGHRHAAADGLQMALLLEPGEPLAGQIRQELAVVTGVMSTGGDGTVSLESGRGVWITPGTVNGHRGRFLVDTGASVVVLSPAFAQSVRAQPLKRAELVMETLNGTIRAQWATVTTFQVGGAQVQNMDVVVRDVGMGDLDGILGNSFLSRWDVSLDPDRRVLRLRPPRAGDAVYASPK